MILEMFVQAFWGIQAKGRDATHTISEKRFRDMIN